MRGDSSLEHAFYKAGHWLGCWPDQLHFYSASGARLDATTPADSWKLSSLTSHGLQDGHLIEVVRSDKSSAACALRCLKLSGNGIREADLRSLRGRAHRCSPANPTTVIVTPF